MPSPMSSPRHFPALDGLRGLAVVLVMLSHFLTAGHVLDSNHPFARLLLGGFVGVDLFFVLSGFLITGILLDAPDDGSHRRFFVTFYGRRALRIWPLYYAALAIAFLCRPMPGNDSPAWYWLLASNLGATLKGRWLESPEGFSLAHFWSLAVEEQFYLLWPLLVRFLKRPVLGKLCLALLIVGPLAHFVLHFAGNPVGAYLFTPTRLHTLAAGAWLAIAFRHPTRWETLTRFAPWVAATAGAITVIGLLFPQNLSLVPFGPFLWGAVLILALAPGSHWATALDRPLPRLFGKFSYGLYVWHYFANPWLKGPVYEKIARFTGHGSILSLAVFVIFAFGFSFAASLLSWWLLEKPCLALKRYFRYGAAPSRAALTDNFSRFSRDNLS